MRQAPKGFYQQVHSLLVGNAAHREPRVSHSLESIGGDLNGRVDHVRGPGQEPFDPSRHVSAVRHDLLYVLDGSFILRTGPPNPTLRDEPAHTRKRCQEGTMEIIK